MAFEYHNLGSNIITRYNYTHAAANDAIIVNVTITYVHTRQIYVIV